MNYKHLVLGLLTLFAGTAAADETVFGVTTANNLIRFTANTPDTIEDTVAITGLQASEDVLGIDFRPASNELFALGSTGRVYTINLDTGAATQVGSGTVTLTGTAFGVDFNPVPDRIRVVSEQDQNIRLNPSTGALANTDTTLAYEAGDANFGVNPNVVGVAYTTNVAEALATTLFGIDSTANILVQQGDPNGSPVSPNAGALATIGTLGTGIDPTDTVGFDIAEGKNGRALAAFVLTGETTSKLYAIDLGGGRATLIGAIGGTVAVRDIAIQRAGTVDFTQATYVVAEGAGNLTVTLEREGGSAVPKTSGTPAPVTISLQTATGTAGASDYTATSTTVSFAEGEIFKTVNIPILQDTTVESPENFTVTLTGETGGLLVTNTGSTQVTILDDDVATPTPTATATPTSTPDTTKPSLLTAVDEDYRRSPFLSQGITVGVSCSESCTITGQFVAPSALSRRLGLGSQATVIGTGTASITGAGKTTVIIKLTDDNKRRFRRVRSAKLTVRVTAVDTANNSSIEDTVISVTR